MKSTTLLLSLLALASCPLWRERPAVMMPANAVWSDDGQEILLLSYHFRPGNADTPYYNALDAQDWSIVAEALSPDLRQRRRLMAWPNESHDGGGIMQKPVYWLRKNKRLIYTESQQPFLHFVGSQRRLTLRAPADWVVRRVGAELARGVSGHSPIPSPDGRYIAVWFNTSYIKGGPLGPQIHTHFVSFFQSRDGSHITSTLLPFSDQEFDPWILPHFLSSNYRATRKRTSSPGGRPGILGRQEAHLGFRYRFLWDKNSTGVYIVTKQESWFLPVSSSETLRAVSRVPLYAVPTRSGPVDQHGELLGISIDKSRPNQTSLQKRRLPKWTALDQIPLSPVSDVNYKRP